MSRILNKNGYNGAGDILVLAYSLYHEGRKEKAFSTIKQFFTEESSEDLIESLNTINQKAIEASFSEMSDFIEDASDEEDDDYEDDDEDEELNYFDEIDVEEDDEPREKQSRVRRR